MNKLGVSSAIIPVLLTIVASITIPKLVYAQQSDDYQTGYQVGVRNGQNYNGNTTQGHVPEGGAQQWEQRLNSVCLSEYSQQYCQGDMDGFFATVGLQNQTSGTVSAPSNTSSSPLRVVTPSIIGGSPMQEFGVFFGPIQIHSGTFHNEKGVFVPWTSICKAGQSYLLESCDSLVNPDGSLTPAGDKAVSCIWNGAVLSTAGAAYLHLPIDTIKSILGPLAGLTGCNGIVNMNQIPNSPQVQSLLQSAAAFAQQH